ncbi:NXPE family member 4-like isoform X1, partial [Biomphalaria glabrata]
PLCLTQKRILSIMKPWTFLNGNITIQLEHSKSKDHHSEATQNSKTARLHILNSDDSKTLKDNFSVVRKVTIHDIMNLFHAKTLDTCSNQCETGRESLCSAVNASDWYTLLKLGNFQVIPYLRKGQYMYEFEKEYMRDPPLKDMRQLPDLKSSKIVISGSDDGKVTCEVPCMLTGRVDLVNGYGQPRRVGGDEVRVWLVDKKTREFRSAGRVTDLNNGSYQISVWCLWPGISKMHVAVPYPREYIRTVIHQTHLSASRFVLGKFLKNGIEEVTLCWSLPNVPGRPCLCNLTEIVGQSFYCGLPLDKRLSCDDWNATSSTPLLQPINVTDAEGRLILTRPTYDITKFTIPNNLQIVVHKNDNLHYLKSCSETGFNVTWDLSTPAGFWKPNKRWSSLHCSRPEMTKEFVESCLSDTTVWFFGDSNSVRLFNDLTALTHCNGLTNSLWPLAGSCSNRKANMTLRFNPHEMPLYQHFHWTPRLGYKSVADYIRATPSVGKYIFIVHYYLHVTPSHLSVLHSRLRHLRDAIAEVASRNPDVLFAFRGPHVVSYDYNYNHAVGGDSLVKFYVQLLLETFRGLRDKVLYLDGWGMSLAIENSLNHPSDSIPEEMIKTVLSFRCNRSGYVKRY